MQLGLLCLVELQDVHEVGLQDVRVELVRVVVHVPHGGHVFAPSRTCQEIAQLLP